MSKKTNRAKLNKATNNHEYRILWLKEEFPPYYDDGMILYPSNRRGYKNPNKRIQSYQVRMYKSWKYNRKTKWK
jgi:hypothetical protein